MSSKSFAREIFWVHLFPSTSDSQSSGFYKVPRVFQNICPAISMQLLVCNLQLLTAGNASRPGVTDAIESCWESCCSLAPCFQRREEEEFVSKKISPARLHIGKSKG